MCHSARPIHVHYYYSDAVTAPVFSYFMTLAVNIHALRTSLMALHSCTFLACAGLCLANYISSYPVAIPRRMRVRAVIVVCLCVCVCLWFRGHVSPLTIPSKGRAGSTIVIIKYRNGNVRLSAKHSCLE